MPGKWKSEVYWAVPLTFNGPSTRGRPRPIGDVAGISGVVAMFDPSVKSACDGHLQGVRKAAPGQLDFERILALRFGIAQRSEERRVGKGCRAKWGAEDK